MSVRRAAQPYLSESVAPLPREAYGLLGSSGSRATHLPDKFRPVSFVGGRGGRPGRTTRVLEGGCTGSAELFQAILTDLVSQRARSCRFFCYPLRQNQLGARLDRLLDSWTPKSDGNMESRLAKP